ncbi:MAG: hypothetical protein LBK60_08535 [Verrucomicrobiales bacterium]|jgi:hypothetical protein|nr:hypothetical protein [Verrucomicrobiales bacterium]
MFHKKVGFTIRRYPEYRQAQAVSFTAVKKFGAGESRKTKVESRKLKTEIISAF